MPSILAAWNSRQTLIFTLSLCKTAYVSTIGFSKPMLLTPQHSRKSRSQDQFVQNMSNIDNMITICTRTQETTPKPLGNTPHIYLSFGSSYYDAWLNDLYLRSSVTRPMRKMCDLRVLSELSALECILKI